MDYFQACNDMGKTQAQGEWLPTGAIRIDREINTHYPETRRCSYLFTPDNLGFFDDAHWHIIHDMPADENGVQVDFITLTEAGYAIDPIGDQYRAQMWKPGSNSLAYISIHHTAIDAWRAAAKHYLLNKPK